MLSKHVQMDVILRDTAVAELYIQEKMERKAAHSVMRVVVKQLEQVADKPLERGWLGDDVRVHALTDPNEELVQLASGKLVITNKEKRSVCPVSITF